MRATAGWVAAGRGVFVLATLLLACLSGAEPAAAKGQKGTKPPPESELSKKLDEAARAAGGPELWGTILVAKGGEIVFLKAYGFADYEKKPNTGDTLYEIASTSKQFAAAAILRLEDMKKLKTTDTLDKVFPDAPKDKRKVTIDHLLHHTSGVSPKAIVAYSWPGSRDQYVERVLSEPLVSVPGEKYEYSNVGYAFLAAIVEVVSKSEFEEFCRKELFAPAGLSDTGFVGDEKLIKSERISRRVCPDCEPKWTAADWHWGWGYRGMGGVVTTAPDLLKWDRALRGEKVLSAAAKKKLYTPALENYACGWDVARQPNGKTRISHSGRVGGFASMFSRWIEEDVVIVVLSNGKKNPHDIEAALQRVVF
jgi:CubicO group peptidase (beta-lactamase class C family)